jgi:dTDP-4-amino-4,6-dideoxygalactose transaminase
MDLAESLAPGLSTEVVGIRPGEKLHEIMCPADDSHLTIEFDDHYVITPSIIFHDDDIDFTINASAEKYSFMHLYVIRLKLEEIKRSHKQVFEFLREQDIGVNLHYIPVHTQPYYRQMGYKTGDFPEAEQYYQEAISLPIFYSMQQDQIDKVLLTLGEVLQ